MEAPGLYVHVPFCVRKCAYCAFASTPDPSHRASFVDDLLAEARRNVAGWEGFDTIYLGGGTPTVLSDADLSRLIGGLKSVFPGADRAEVTLEANPDDLPPDRPARLRDLGVDRLSLGVQTFDDARLRVLGRRHDGAGARRALEAVARAGFSAFSVDLMVGLPGQDDAAIRTDLDEALSFGPDHLSCYQLTLEEGTPLHRDAARGRLAGLPAADDPAPVVAVADHLGARGWIHYEVSSWARDLERVSTHNRKYWFHVPYLGLGPAAHSYRDRNRWWNPRSVDAWRRRVHGEGSVPADRETLTDRDLALERLMLGLRTCWGVERVHVDPDALAPLVEDGVLEIRGDRVVPTDRGMLLADGLAWRLAPG